MSVAIAEQETVVNFCRDEKHATIYTSDSTVMTRLDKMVESSPEFWRLLKEDRDRSGELVSKTYIVYDKSLISFRRAKVKLSEEQREARMRQLGKFPQ